MHVNAQTDCLESAPQLPSTVCRCQQPESLYRERHRLAFKVSFVTVIVLFDPYSLLTSPSICRSFVSLSNLLSRRISTAGSMSDIESTISANLASQTTSLPQRLGSLFSVAALLLFDR